MRARDSGRAVRREALALIDGAIALVGGVDSPAMTTPEMVVLHGDVLHDDWRDRGRGGGMDPRGRGVRAGWRRGRPSCGR